MANSVRSRTLCSGALRAFISTFAQNGARQSRMNHRLSRHMSSLPQRELVADDELGVNLLEGDNSGKF